MYAFSFIYNTDRYRQTHPQPVQQTSVVLTSHAFSRKPKYKYRQTNMNVHKGWVFPRGIYSEVHSPITTPEIICVMAFPVFRGNGNTIIVVDSQTSPLPIFPICAPCDEENRERNNILILAVKTRRKRNISYGMNIRNVYISVWNTNVCGIEYTP